MPNYFTVDGLAPLDPAWHAATVAQRAAYLRVCRVLVLNEWEAQTAAGIGANGKTLAPLKMATRLNRHSEMGPADPNAPPLIPAHRLSRTISLVDAKITGGVIRVFWKFDAISGMRWGTILNYHREGKGNLPKRDVFGLAPAAFERVKKQAHRWWSSYVRGLPVVMPTRRRGGKAARAAAAVLPAYEPKTPDATGRPRVEPTTADVALGSDIYTMSKSAAAELLGAVRGGRFNGFRSYE